jgi:hypothetical protein
LNALNYSGPLSVQLYHAPEDLNSSVDLVDSVVVVVVVDEAALSFSSEVKIKIKVVKSNR